MKPKTIGQLAICLLLFKPCIYAEEGALNSPATVVHAAIVGTVSDGAVSPALPIAIPQFKVLQRSVSGSEANKLTFSKVVPLLIRPLEPVPVPIPVPLVDAQATNEIPKESFLFLSATVFGGQRTLLRWLADGSSGEEFMAWSNVNFMHLSGFGTFKMTFSDGTDQTANFIMALGEEPLEQAEGTASFIGKAIPNLPSISEGPTFEVIKGSPSNIKALQAIVALHEIYKRESPALIAAFERRRVNAKEYAEAMRANPPKKDVEIFYWRKTAR